MQRISKDEAAARIAAEPASACTMCNLVETAPRIAENAAAVAVLARYAVRRGHVLVVLRRHEIAVPRLAREEWLALNDLSWHVTQAIEQALAPARTYVAALGSVTPRPTTFPHVHEHVVPLFDGGESDRPSEVFTWSNGVYVYDDEDAEALEETLRRAMSSTGLG